jgi:serine/threonine-protein kinase PknG
VRPLVESASHSDNCVRPGCNGTMSDGYCDVCGLAPPGSSARVAAAASTTAAPSAGSAGSDPNGSAESRTNTVRRFAGTNESTGRLTGVTSSGSGRSSLGAGLVDMPTVPERDPRAAVLGDPEVPERKRSCGRCNEPVGRARGPRAARTEGFCPHCGARYSFTPKLNPGDLVAGQYQVAGCLAHGGLGWIYLAQDLNLDGSWVVLKGLLDSGDDAAMAAALVEKRYLTEVKHPNIVRIYNFVQHADAGYIVMEYIGGESLRELRVRHREETGGPLSVAQSIAYMLGILPALDFLHRRGLLFCDFKPDNVIHTEEQLTLIDLGGVRHIDDQVSDLYGTAGYQAPEIAEGHASIASDLYTVARALAVLSVDFPGYQDEKRHAYKLPPVKDVPAFQRYESFHLFLQKATATDPSARFQSAAEMIEQLLGVLRQVVALDGGSPPSVPSTLFSAELGASPDENLWSFLPIPAVDPMDPAAGVVATIALLPPDQRQALLDSTPRSPELSLTVARLAIDEGDLELAERELETSEARESGWRVAWWHGVLLLAEDRPADALPYFSAVAAEMPGELAPKLAMATCFEEDARQRAAAAPTGNSSDAGTAQLHDAVGYYSLVAGTDPGFASASFGLARVYEVLGDRDEAVSALQRIPKSSSAYLTAQIALCRVRCATLRGQTPTFDDLSASSSTLGGLRLENSVRLPLERDLHQVTLRLLLQGSVHADAAVLIGGAELDEDGQRMALEKAYRSLAKLSTTQSERWSLVDLANECRPRTRT